MEQETEKEKQEKTKIIKMRCPKCNSAQTYGLKDGTRVCRKCSYRENTNPSEKKKEVKE